MSFPSGECLLCVHPCDQTELHLPESPPWRCVVRGAMERLMWDLGGDLKPFCGLHPLSPLIGWLSSLAWGAAESAPVPFPWFLLQLLQLWARHVFSSMMKFSLAAAVTTVRGTRTDSSFCPAAWTPAHPRGFQLVLTAPPTSHPYSFLMVCPADPQLQPVTQRQRLYGDCLTSPPASRVYGQIPETNTAIYVGKHGLPRGLRGKNLPIVQEPQEAWVGSLGQGEPLGKGMATHSSILAWSIPWTEEPGRLQSIGLRRVGHDCSNLACMWANTHTRMQAFVHLPVVLLVCS